MQIKKCRKLSFHNHVQGKIFGKILDDDVDETIDSKNFQRLVFK